MTELSKKIIKSAANPNLAAKMFAELGESQALEILQQNHNKELTDEIFRQPALNGGLEYGDLYADDSGNSEGVKFTVIYPSMNDNGTDDRAETGLDDALELDEVCCDNYDQDKKLDAAALYLKAIEADGKTPEEAAKLAMPIAKREAAKLEANIASMWKSETSYSKLG